MAVDPSLIEDYSTYQKIEGDRPKGMKRHCCPFCDGDTHSGSWSPDTCEDCGAVEFFGAWTRDKIKE